MLYHLKILLFLLEILSFKCDDEEPLETIFVSPTILQQELYYHQEDIINNSFIDLANFKIYNISMENIYHTTNTDQPNFRLIWANITGKNELSIECKMSSEKKVKCAHIDLSDHSFITFDYDRLITKLGGIFAYILILYGLFSLRRGYVYYNLTVIFYGSFSYILLIREICECFELNQVLNSDEQNSINILYTVFTFSLVTCILYGYLCHFSKYLKYINFGFINGLFLTKIIYYFFIKILSDYFILVYYLFEIFICLFMIILFIFLQNKYLYFNITCIVIISSYGILFGLNILFGGLPFIPYHILIKLWKDEDFHERLCSGNFKYAYGTFFILMCAYGFYKNYINYQIAMNKKIKK